MNVKCAKCGEELLGAVNRCWRCGTIVAAEVSDAALPPIRRTPLVPEAHPPMADVRGVGEPVEVASVVEVREADEAKQNVPNAASSPGHDDDSAAGVPTQSPGGLPAGSVSGRAEHLAADSRLTPANRLPKTDRPQSARDANAGGAIAALILGGMSFLFSYFTPLALVPAVIGLAMSIWGLCSTRRGLAIAGVALCCIALAVSGFNALVALYTLQHGYAPWEAPEEFEVYDDAYFEERGDL